ncbi:MAG: GTPase Era [Phycisphaerales bacterium]|nr:GTPase Era [Phycisphaerales bacterium]
MKSGFVTIFGKPNAGKSTLFNALINENLAITSPKVQTTRNRIKGILTKDESYQIIFSDIPGLITDPSYALQQRMMGYVNKALDDADVIILLVDGFKINLNEIDNLFRALKLKIPAILVINKIDRLSTEELSKIILFFKDKPYAHEIIPLSAIRKDTIPHLLDTILTFLPQGEFYYDNNTLTDAPNRFFVAELIREQSYTLYQDELPYHLAVIINQYQEKKTLTKIVADIIVHRESQKGIILGERGTMIKQLGTLSRKTIEEFIGQKVFLELFVKVRPNWRNNKNYLDEYGYY